MSRVARRTGRRRVTAALAGCAALALAACGTGGDYAPTALPQTPTVTSAPSAPATTPATCRGDVTASYDPFPDLAAGRAAPGLAEIVERGRLVVGVSADSRLLGARNPATNAIEGFDIDAARAVSQALFGSPDRVVLRVITAADRIPLLQDGGVDLVARNFTITCDRWQQIAFSGTYYLAGQRVLVPTSSVATQVTDLAKGSRVCAPTGSTSLAALGDYPDLVPVGATAHTQCLVLLQQGRVDAITGDDTVLAGLAAQDPYTKVIGDKFSREPYGLGVDQDNRDLVRFVNAALAQWRADGGWQRSYDRWLAPALGRGAPPTPVYGRTGPTG